MAKHIIFNINGGIGKCVAATAVCSAIKKKYPHYDLIVVSGYPDVFVNNPNVKKTLAFGQTPYFHSDYIESHDVKIFAHDPYQTTDYIKRTKHLIHIWCDLYGLDYDNEMPEIFLTKREIDFFQKQVNLRLPMFLIQTNGGGDVNKKYSWARDIPYNVVVSVIEKYKDQYDFVHVKRDDQISYPNTIPLTGTFRQVMAVSMLSEKRLVMDSFLQHGLAALNMPATALWIVNSPKVFGYDIHTHVLANPFTVVPELRNSYFEKFSIGGDEVEFPYRNESEIFSVYDVISAIEKTTNPPIKQDFTDDKIKLNS